MELDRKYIYNFPWTKEDNPGAWIEVTDICNLNCPGCFRKNGYEGHRPFDTIKKEIIQCKKMTNCKRISISGGEPLLYPQIKEVVRFIKEQNLDSIILTNGDYLTLETIRGLKEAGLNEFFIHVDNGQNRPDWQNKSEVEMNGLRQHYADMVHEIKGVKCGFNMTIRPSNFKELPEIIKWFRKNIDRLNHISFITLRGIPTEIANSMQFEGQKINLKNLPETVISSEEFNIQSNDVFNHLDCNLEDIVPAGYLKGTAIKESYKLIASVNIGSKNKIYGAIGPKTMKMFQEYNKKLTNKYEASVKNYGRLVFIMALFDKIVRKALKNYMKEVSSKPNSLFEKIYLQSIIIQQPFELINGKLNLCDGCMNLMPFKDEMINSCRYDEYRLLGGPIKYSS